MKDILFHVHTRFSYDSYMDPEKIVAKSRELGYKGVVVVDHQNIQGGLEAKRFETDDFKVIVAGEYHTRYGDIVGINLSKNIDSSEPKEVVDQIHQQGGQAIWVHPKRTFLLPRGRGKSKPLPPEEFIKSLDYIETYNAQTRPSQNQAAKVIAKKFNIPEISGLDAHFYFELRRDLRGYSLLGYLGTFVGKNLKGFFPRPDGRKQKIHRKNPRD